uniref:CSON002308 protein n=1 Tax=Culicoides sonorensis TaxID=179676 RepID=A0A336MIQ1_CULSO
MFQKNIHTSCLVFCETSDETGAINKKESSPILNKKIKSNTELSRKYLN